MSQSNSQQSNIQQSNIQQSIESLRNEVAKLSETDVSVQTKLLSLIEDMERQIESPEPSHAESSQKIPALIEQFESDHPKITNALGDLLTTLSSMGV